MNCLGLVKDAIVQLKSRNGSSVVAISNFINQGDHRKQIQLCINRALKRGTVISAAPLHPFSFKLVVTKKIKVKSASTLVKKTKSVRKNGLAKKTAKKTNTKLVTSATKPARKAKSPAASPKIITPQKTKAVGAVPAGAKKKSAVTAAASAGPLPAATPTASLEVVAISGLQSQGHVYQDGADIYNIDLALQDASVNANKFYHLQVIESHDRTKYWSVQHWGRIGQKGQCKVEGPTSLDLAIATMKKKYKEKKRSKL